MSVPTKQFSTNAITYALTFSVFFCLYTQNIFASPGEILEPSSSGLVQLTAISKDALTQARSQIPQEFASRLPTVKNGIAVYKIVYETPDVHGKPSEASGLLMVPDSGKGPYPLLSYQHGTLLDPKMAPSISPAVGEYMEVALFYAALGYVVTIPDYLGFGVSQGHHPYCHSDTLASASANLLRAARNAQGKLSFSLDSQLFLAGYSEGGLATMALHRYLEQELSAEFKVTASAPMSGPYDLSGTTVREAVVSPGPHVSAELAYLLDGMDTAYGIFTSYDGVIVPSLASKLQAILAGSRNMGDILALLPSDPKQFLEPSFLDTILGNSSQSLAGTKFIDALRKSDAYEWKPLAPVTLYYGGADHDVPADNAKFAYQRLKSLGGNVTITNLGDSLDHVQAAPPAMMSAAIWFETLRK
jgi:pimeloyl-ACP methyl ester carboxylesterase